MKRKVTTYLTCALMSLPVCLPAQTKVEIAVNADSQNLAQRTPIAPDFAGLSFEITSLMPGANGLAPGVHLFDPQANPQPLALFQQMGIKSLRVGAATGDGCKTPFPTHADLDALFHFARQAHLKIIYQFRLINPAACDIPGLTQQSAETARYLWSHYAANIAALSTGNEDDYHTAHSFCTDGSACACVAGRGCSCRDDDPQCAQSRAGLAIPPLVIRDPLMYEVGISQAMTNAGSAFPSYLEEWRNYMAAITALPGLAHVPVAGPDAFSYTRASRITGSVCGSFFTSAAWPELLAACERSDPKINFRSSYGHYYVGGQFVSGAYRLSAAEGIADMLSPAWLQGEGILPEPVQPPGIPHDQQLVYTPYAWLYKYDYEPIRKLGVDFRLTESNDYLGGVPDGSNSFASALWALDYMHWWAEHGASGVNFHNNQWIYTDTLAPRHNTWKAPGVCRPGPCADYYVTPKGYGIKAFNMGGHGYPLETSVRALHAPRDWSLTAYAVRAGQDLYITVINKTQGNQPDHRAQVSLRPAGLPFAKASVATLTLSSGLAGDAGRLAAQLGGAGIASSGEQWRGVWTPHSPETSGTVTLAVAPATAVIVRLHAGSLYSGPVGMNQNGALELFAAGRQGRLWHAWQQAGPKTAAAPWSHWSDAFSAGLPPVKGGWAIARNQDNTLQAFAATAKGVYTAHQQPQGGAWSPWALLRGEAPSLSGLRAAQNADGSLSIFGLDESGHLWMATEAAPGVAWAPWRRLAKLAGGVQQGFAVAANLNGRVAVFALDRSAHPALWQIGQTLDNHWEVQWSRLGAPPRQILQPGLQVGRTLAGKLSVFALGVSPGTHGGDLWTLTQNSPGRSWGSWTALPVLRAASPASRFVALQNSDGRFEVICTASDGKIYRTAQAKIGHWQRAWTALSGTAAPKLTDSALAAGNTGDGRLQIFATDRAGTVYSTGQQTPGGRWDGRWTVIGTGNGLTFSR